MFKIMKFIRQWKLYILVIVSSILILNSCEEDYTSDAQDKGLPLSVGNTNIKAPGKGQYRLEKRLVEGTAVITADLSSFVSVSSFTITKRLNGTVDNTFGTNGVMSVTPASTYNFNYALSDQDVDQLVTFTFLATHADGVAASDLTLKVSLTPRENIPRKKWLWTSRLWVDNGNSQDLKECEKDNYFLFNADSTITVNYGANTAAGDCVFDGFTIYDKWHLTADEKYFIIEKHGLFDPTVVMDTFRMKTLTTETLEMEIDIDLTIFGLTADETFLYQYTAQPK